MNKSKVAIGILMITFGILLMCFIGCNEETKRYHKVDANGMRILWDEYTNCVLIKTRNNSIKVHTCGRVEKESIVWEELNPNEDAIIFDDTENEESTIVFGGWRAIEEANNNVVEHNTFYGESGEVYGNQEEEEIYELDENNVIRMYIQ